MILWISSMVFITFLPIVLPIETMRVFNKISFCFFLTSFSEINWATVVSGWGMG